MSQSNDTRSLVPSLCGKSVCPSKLLGPYSLMLTSADGEKVKKDRAVSDGGYRDYAAFWDNSLKFIRVLSVEIIAKSFKFVSL